MGIWSLLTGTAALKYIFSSNNTKYSERLAKETLFERRAEAAARWERTMAGYDEMVAVIGKKGKLNEAEAEILERERIVYQQFEMHQARASQISKGGISRLANILFGPLVDDPIGARSPSEWLVEEQAQIDKDLANIDAARRALDSYDPDHNAVTGPRLTELRAHRPQRI